VTKNSRPQKKQVEAPVKSGDPAGHHNAMQGKKTSREADNRWLFQENKKCQPIALVLGWHPSRIL
jgi:hypothetical protein